MTEASALAATTDPINLTHVSFLVADGSSHYREIFRSILNRFGAIAVHEAETDRAAQTLLQRREIDVMIVAHDLPGIGGIALVKQLRMDENHPKRSIPILIAMGAARRARIRGARDCGANFVIAKPVSPAVLYDRLSWIAQANRPFWSGESYYGPDRRFREDEHYSGPQRRELDGHQESIDSAFEDSVPEEAAQ